MWYLIWATGTYETYRTESDLLTVVSQYEAWGYRKGRDFDVERSIDMKNKEDAVKDFANMIRNSWTYGRMTKEEQAKVIDLLFWDTPCVKAIKGSYLDRWRTCQAIYSAYLSGIGYTPYGWREDSTEPVPTF